MTTPATPTYVACLTPPGTGAIATLAIRGPTAWTVLHDLFRPASKRPLPEVLPEAGRIWYGQFGHDRMADEVVVAVNETTPLPWIEIHSHGGRQNVGWLTEILVQRGLTECSWQEFYQAIETPLRATAREQLTQTTTVRTAAILLDQYHGALEKVLCELRYILQLGDTGAACAKMDELLRFATLGLRLVEPWRVVVAGAPNVGKSSLINSLAGYQRSIVASMPGTTRDLVTARIAIDGWSIELTDTAGLRATGTALENAGMDLAHERMCTADLCVWVVDATSDPIWPDARLRGAETSMILVVNKTDQPMSWNRTLAKEALFISALTGEGLSGLCGTISQRLVPSPPPAGAPVPFERTLIQTLETCRAEIAAGRCKEALDLLSPWT